MLLRTTYFSHYFYYYCLFKLTETSTYFEIKKVVYIVLCSDWSKATHKLKVFGKLSKRSQKVELINLIKYTCASHGLQAHTGSYSVLVKVEYHIDPLFYFPACFPQGKCGRPWHLHL